MIKNKEDYKYYLHCDEIARWGHEVSRITKWKKGDLWRYNVYLRKSELAINRDNFIDRIKNIYYKFKLEKYSRRTGWSIHPNTFGPGLLVVHRGTVVVNKNARIGENCRVHVCVNIGDWNGGSPVIGDNVYIGPGVKIFGGVEIASNIAIGANAVVNKSFTESGISIAGVPAVKISDKGNKYDELGKR